MSFHPLKASLAALALCLTASGCSPMVSAHGNMLTPAKLSQVTPMTSTRADVEQAWGPPTLVPAFDPNTWYYVGEVDKRTGIFAPKVDKRTVVKVTFDGSDMVTDVSEVDPKLAEDVTPVSRTTPSAGKEYTAVQQFLGNLGKFNKKKGEKDGN
ncbi:MAG: outer membrane protein assembly factor BamE [Alphaproteobacteria bacterium]|nr:outer membrane protein assembly factor BamE [Alphaproteobacteria bacterium]